MISIRHKSGNLQWKNNKKYLVICLFIYLTPLIKQAEFEKAIKTF